MTLPATAMTGVPIRVMIVDDSAIIRGLLQRALKESAGIEVVAVAFNGLIALSELKKTQVDVILLDIEMPEMDGITALPELLKIAPDTRVIMVSTLTLRNAEISLSALGLGASDYVTKPSSRKDDQEVRAFYQELIEKIRALAPKRRSGVPAPAPAATAPPAPAAPKTTFTPPAVRYPKQLIRALAIGSSTGGPQALATLFRGLVGRMPHQPIFITQHMPATFTTILAQQIAQITGRPCAEAKDGEEALPGSIYVAPGNFHMQPEKSGTKIVIRLNQNPPVNFCRPAVDPMLQSLNGIYGSSLLVAILTGMGSDGVNGAREVVASGGTIIAQNEQTSVVWGMPRAVAEANICSAVLPLPELADYITKACA